MSVRLLTVHPAPNMLNGRIYPIILIVAFLFLTINFAQATQTLAYFPTKVELSGYVVLQQHYGPPNFGEDPDNDAKIDIYVLKLDKPVDVISTTRKGPDSDSFINVKTIELVDVGNPKKDFLQYLDEHVKIEGRLYEKEDLNQYTDVLITVDQISSANKGQI